jgi:hypothetical protein
MAAESCSNPAGSSIKRKTPSSITGVGLFYIPKVYQGGSFEPFLSVESDEGGHNVQLFWPVNQLIFKEVKNLRLTGPFGVGPTG